MHTRNHPPEAEEDDTKVETMDQPSLSGLYFSLVGTTIIFIFIAAVLMLTTSCQRDDANGKAASAASDSKALTFFVAASMTDVITRAVEDYERGEVKLNFAASSTLARQIDAGAGADLYLSANKKWMDFLVEKGIIEADTVRLLASNRLVLITPKSETFTYDGTTPLPDTFEGRLSIGDPNHVPAGMYAKEALQNLGWWSDLETRIAPAPDVRQALRTVALGEVEAGIVYSTDARAEEHVTAVWTLPPDSHQPILYYVAILKESSADAAALLDYLTGPETKVHLDQLGFAEPPEVKI